MIKFLIPFIILSGCASSLTIIPQTEAISVEVFAEPYGHYANICWRSIIYSNPIDYKVRCKHYLEIGYKNE